MIAADGNADAHRRVDFLAQQIERNRQSLLNARGYRTSFFFTSHVVEQYSKLVSTDAPEHVVLAQAGLHSMCDLDQQLVSASVAQTVVDQLEPIDIKQQHRILPIFVRSFPRDAQLDHVVEASAVRQTGKRVLRQLLFRFLAVADVLDLEEQPLGASLGIFQERYVPEHPNCVALFVNVALFLFMTWNVAFEHAQDVRLHMTDIVLVCESLETGGSQLLL